jgi:hypothetical protein
VGTDAASWTLTQLENSKRYIEVSVPWTNKTVFLVPGAVVAAQLVHRGISRGRIWTVSETRKLLLAGVDKETFIKIAATKVMFGASLTEAEQGASRDVTLPASPDQEPSQLSLLA